MSLDLLPTLFLERQFSGTNLCKKSSLEKKKKDTNRFPRALCDLENVITNVLIP